MLASLPWMRSTWTPSLGSATLSSRPSCATSSTKPGQKHLQQPELKCKAKRLRTSEMTQASLSAVVLTRHSWRMCKPALARSRKKSCLTASSTMKTRPEICWLRMCRCLSFPAQRRNWVNCWRKLQLPKHVALASLSLASSVILPSGGRQSPILTSEFVP